jgi:hypothetical protein
MKRSNVVLVACQGGTAFDPTHVDQARQALEQFGSSVSVVGDGVKPVGKMDIVSAISNANRNDSPTTVFIMAHGFVNDGKHVLMLDQKQGLPTENLFDLISSVSKGKPVDVFMTACHGGAAVPSVDRLPTGSALVALAPGSETVAGSDVDRMVAGLQAIGSNAGGDVSASRLLDVYLGVGLKNRIAPVMAVSGEGVHDLPREFEARVGTVFSGTEKANAHQRLDDIIGSDRVDAVMGRVTSATSEWDVYAADFGPALAISGAAQAKLRPLSLYNPSRGSHSSGHHAGDIHF